MFSFWEKISGSKEEFSAEQRSFNALSIVNLVLLVVLLPFNMILDIPHMVTMLSVLIVFVVFVYYLSRFRKKFYIGVTLYATLSYLSLIYTYYNNAGIDGPTLSLFILTFMLLIAFTPRKQHWLWGCLHLAVGTALVLAEHLAPDMVQGTYHNLGARYFDIITSYVVIICLIYFATIFLRNNYEEEKKLSDKQERSIVAQNERLEILNQEKNKLFSIISHDLRSPINSIRGYLQIIGQQNLSADERSYWESELLQQTDRTLEMLSNILSWSKSQMDGKEVRVKKVNLHKTLSNTIEVQKAISAGKGVKLHYAPDPSVCAMADPDMLQLVVRNLISNSIKFTDAGGEITLRITATEKDCHIMIKDNGIGMTEALQKQVFSLNIEPTLGTMNEKGVGLGLALCKEYIELQHGNIWFESIANAGTIFYISLPLAIMSPSASVQDIEA